MNLRNRKSPRGVQGYRPGVAALEERLLMAVDVLTYHNSNSRSGANESEQILSPANVNATNFGKVGFDAADGKVDAEPLLKAGVTIPGQGVHDVLVVVTEHDSVYGFDAATGATLWHTSMLGPGETPSDPVHGTQVVPEIGITSTPVIDGATGTIYVVAMSKRVSGGTTTYFQRIHALDIATGLDKVAPKSIDSSISYPGAGPGGDGTKVIFDPMQYKERDALILVNGVVYTSWASHSDVAPYTGWVIGFKASDLGVASVLNVDPNGAPTSSFLDDGSGSSFWNSGAGPAADSQGNLYNISGNGPFDPTLDANGFPANGDFGDSYLKLATSNGLAVADYFTPYNQQALANADTDLGSSGLLLVEFGNRFGLTFKDVIGSGKDGNIYVLQQDSLGEFNPTHNAIYQEIDGALGGPEFGAPVYWQNQVYFGAVGATLKGFLIDSRGQFVQNTPLSQSATSYGYPGTTPAISSRGAADGILWAVENGDTAVLHAYDAFNLNTELYNSNQAANGRDHFGPGNKFITPMIANGRVYVGTTNGVAVFGLLPTLPGPTVVVGANPSPVTGTTAVLSANVTDPNFPIGSDLTFAWSVVSSPAGAPTPTFDASMGKAENTGVKFAAPGAYTFAFTATDPIGHATTKTLTLNVVSTATAVTLSPRSVTLDDGQSQAFAATVVDQFGATVSPTPKLYWGIVPGGVGSVNQAGVYSAPTTGSGQADVVVTTGAVLAESRVTVNATVVIPPAPTQYHVNFTGNPSESPAAYASDTGQVLGPQGVGLFYGWNKNNTANAVERNNPAAPDELHDSYVAMQGRSAPNASWTIAIPNGVYYVRLIAGDPTSNNGVYRMNINGVLALKGTPKGAKHWVESTVAVRVTNNRITVSNARGARNNKLDAIDIVAAPTVVTPASKRPAGPRAIRAKR